MVNSTRVEGLFAAMKNNLHPNQPLRIQETTVCMIAELAK
jgi:hypothetical protein